MIAKVLSGALLGIFVRLKQRNNEVERNGKPPKKAPRSVGAYRAVFVHQ